MTTNQCGCYCHSYPRYWTGTTTQEPPLTFKTCPQCIGHHIGCGET